MKAVTKASTQVKAHSARFQTALRRMQQRICTAEAVLWPTSEKTPAEPIAARKMQAIPSHQRGCLMTVRDFGWGGASRELSEVDSVGETDFADAFFDAAISAPTRWCPIFCSVNARAFVKAVATVRVTPPMYNPSTIAGQEGRQEGRDHETGL